MPDAVKRAPAPVHPRRYRFGFLATERRLAGTVLWSSLQRAWRTEQLGPLTFHLHPETPFRTVEGGVRTLALIGEAYGLGRTLDEALQQLTAGEPVPEVLDGLAGRFALIVIEGTRWRVFHDAFGSRTVFYGKGAVASHAQLLAHATGVRRDPDVAAFMQTLGYQKRTVRYLPGDLTVHAGIYGLAPNNGYDGSARTTFRYWPLKPLRPCSFDVFSDRMIESVQALAEHVRGRRPVVGLTGGIDSRVVVAALRATDVPFDGVTWEGGYLKPEERPIVAQLRPLADQHFVMRVRRSRPLNKIATLAGENGGCYRGPARLVQEMAAVGEGLFVRGYGGEIARGFYNLWQREPTPLSAKGFLATYTYGGIALDETYRELGEAAFSGFIERANYAGLEAMGYEIADLFYWEHRMGMWGAGMLNEMDAAICSIVGLNSRPMFEAAMGLPRQERLTKALLARVIERLAPELAAIPYL